MATLSETLERSRAALVDQIAAIDRTIDALEADRKIRVLQRTELQMDLENIDRLQVDYAADLKVVDEKITADVVVQPIQSAIIESVP